VVAAAAAVVALRVFVGSLDAESLG
jgi:hypothetical protein